MSKLRLVLLLGLPLAVALPRPAAAQLSSSRKAEARQHYEAGSRKFDVAKYDEAAAEFEAAYEIIGDGVILYNIAQSYRLAQKHERALFFYKSYLRRVDNPPNRTEVESRIADLTKVLAEQKRATEAPPTTLSGDKGTPERPTRVASTGTRTTEPIERPIEKPEPKPEPTATTPEETQPEPTQPAPQAPSRAPMYRAIGYSLLGVAVAGIAVGAAGAALATSASSNVESAAKNHMAFDPSQETNGKNFDIMGIVGWTLAGLSAAGAGVFLYLGLRPHRSTRAMLPTVVPLASSQTAGMAVIGRF